MVMVVVVVCVGGGSGGGGGVSMIVQLDLYYPLIGRVVLERIQDMPEHSPLERAQHIRVCCAVPAST